jgi:hypothetical protein
LKLEKLVADIQLRKQNRERKKVRNEIIRNELPINLITRKKKKLMEMKNLKKLRDYLKG